MFPPKRPAPKSSATPSTSRDQGDLAEKAGGTRGRSSSRGPRERRQRSRSSARGSKKCRLADPNDSLMDRMANFMASGWRRDLTHFIGCCWSAQIGSLERDEWHAAITKFLAVMAKKKNREWTDMKELTPLQFMPYMAKLFREVTGRNLSGLSQFTGWIGIGGYYHWRVVQQGLAHLVPHLAGQPAPWTPDARPSGKPLPSDQPPTETPSTGASGQQQGRSQPAPRGGRPEPTPSQGRRPATSSQSQSGMAAAPKQSGKAPTPRQGGEPASTGKSKPSGASGGPSNSPRVEEGQATALGLTGTKCTCARPKGGYLNPQGLCTWWGWQRRGERPLDTSTIGWPEKNHPSITSPLGP